MNDQMKAGLKALVQGAVTWLAARGIDIDGAALEVVVYGLSFGIVTLATNLLVKVVAEKFPWLAKVFPLPTYDQA